MNKICPFISRDVMYAGNEDCKTENRIDCLRAGCQLWIQVYSTEKLPFYCCVFEMMAMKNTEGLYRV